MECLITLVKTKICWFREKKTISVRRGLKELGNEICVKKYQERLSVKWQKVRVNEAMGGT